MQFQILAVAFAALAAAAPGPSKAAAGYTNGNTPLKPAPAGSVPVCGNNYVPQCCATNVLGLLGLECAPVPYPISSKDNFKGQCAAQGLSNNCCLIPILNQGLVCQAA